MKSSPEAIALPKHRWYAPTPAKFLWAMLFAQSALLLSSHYRWFWFNEHKGYTVLIAIAATTSGLLLLGSGMLVGRLVQRQAQFGLATLFILVVVVAIPAGWLAREMDVARQQRAAVADIRGRGGDVSYGDASPLYERGGFRCGNAPPEPREMPARQGLSKQLESILGRDFFDDVHYIALWEARGVAVESVKDLKRLEVLRLSWTTVTSEGLKNLRDLTQLKILDFCCSGGESTAGDAGMEHLRGLTQLEELSFAHSEVEDAGFAHLRCMRKLIYLDFDCPRITDEGLLHLAELKELRVLAISPGRFTKEGLQRLKEALPRLSIRLISPSHSEEDDSLSLDDDEASLVQEP